MPVGIRFDPNSSTDEDRVLARAYRFLSTPFTAPLELITEDGYSLKDAQNTLLGRGYGKNVARLLFDEIDALVNTDVDALDFEAINPHYNPLKYQPDGLRTTRKEHDLLAAEVSNDNNNYVSPRPLVDTPVDTATAPESLLPTTSVMPLTEDPAHLDAVTLSSIPTPISASTSTSASAAASAYSSTSSTSLPPSTGPGPNSWHAKSSNRKRHAAEFPKMPRPPKRVDAGTRDWSNYFKAQVERGVKYSGQAVAPLQPQAVEESRHATEMRRHEYEHPRHELAVAPRIATPAPHSLLGQEKQMVFCDSDTGAMAAMPVFKTSFASLGVSFSTTVPRQEMPFEPSSSFRPRDVPGQTAPSHHDHSRHLPSPLRDYPRCLPLP